MISAFGSRNAEGELIQKLLSVLLVEKVPEHDSDPWLGRAHRPLDVPHGVRPSALHCLQYRGVKLPRVKGRESHDAEARTLGGPEDDLVVSTETARTVPDI